MTIKQGALVGLVLLLACAYDLAGKPGRDRDVPEQINLDIPPDEPPDPEKIRRHQLAIEAIVRPHQFHDWLLRLEPEREAEETLAAIQIQFPEEYQKHQPLTPEWLQATARAEQAIRNPRSPFYLPPEESDQP